MKYIYKYVMTIALLLCLGCSTKENLTYDDCISTGRKYIQEGNPEKAIVYFEKAKDIKPDESINHLVLGRLYDELWQKSYDEAYLIYKEEVIHGAKTSPNLHDELMKRGLKDVYKKLALHEYREVVRTDQSNLEARNYVGLYYLNNKEYSLAIYELQNSIKYGDKSSLVYWRLADAYQGAGDFNRALESINNAYHIEKRLSYYQYRLGQLYFKMKNYDKAFQMLTTLKNSNSPYYDNLVEFKISNGM